MMKILKYQFMIAIFTLGVSFNSLAGPDGAKDRDTYQSQNPGKQTAPKLSQSELDKFKSAFTEIRAIRKEYSAQLESVDDAKTAKRLQEKAQVDMINAVEEAGLSVEKYNQITTTIQENPELQARVFGEN